MSVNGGYSMSVNYFFACELWDWIEACFEMWIEYFVIFWWGCHHLGNGKFNELPWFNTLRAEQIIFCFPETLSKTFSWIVCFTFYIKMPLNYVSLNQQSTSKRSGYGLSQQACHDAVFSYYSSNILKRLETLLIWHAIACQIILMVNTFKLIATCLS